MADPAMPKKKICTRVALLRLRSTLLLYCKPIVIFSTICYGAFCLLHQIKNQSERENKKKKNKQLREDSIQVLS